jgi:hypothetical protein
MDSNSRLLGDLNSMENYDFFYNKPLLTDPDNPNPYDSIPNKCKFFVFSSFTSPLPNPSEPIFLSTNIQCLQSKFESLKHYILSLTSKNIPITVIALQEIWQISEHANLTFPGFKLLHATGKNAKGGGVGFFIKNEIPYKMLPELSPFEDRTFETLSIEISINKKTANSNQHL